MEEVLPSYIDSLKTVTSKNGLLTASFPNAPLRSGQQLSIKLACARKSFAEAGFVAIQALLTGACDLSTPALPPLRHAFLEAQDLVSSDLLAISHEATLSFSLPETLTCACRRLPTSFELPKKAASRAGVNFSIKYYCVITARSTKRFQGKTILVCPFYVDPVDDLHLTYDPPPFDSTSPFDRPMSSTETQIDRSFGTGSSTVILSRAKLDVIHAHNTHASISISFRACVHLGHPVVASSWQAVASLLSSQSIRVGFLCVLHSKLSATSKTGAMSSALEVPIANISVGDAIPVLAEDGQISSAVVTGSFSVDSKDARPIKTCNAKTKYFLHVVLAAKSKSSIDLHAPLFQAVDIAV